MYYQVALLLIAGMHFLTVASVDSVGNSTDKVFGCASGLIDSRLSIAAQLIHSARQMLPKNSNEIDRNTICEEKSLNCSECENCPEREKPTDCSECTCKEKPFDCSEYRISCNDGKPTDCSDIYKNGCHVGGQYTVWLKKATPQEFVLPVYCDMQSGGGWTELTMSFPGCIRNAKALSEALVAERRSLSQNVTVRCSNMVEEGTFFSADGGHLILYDTYRVGQRVTITVDVKPRSLSGVLIAVHGRSDYLVLQMIDGSLKFSVDNGAGAIETVYTPDDNHELCDGAWHIIHVVKSSNVVTMSVDGNFANSGIGVGGQASTDTNDPLYIGGIPDPSRAKGMQTTEQFAGCMRYLELDSKPQSMAQSRIVSEVSLNACPII